MLRLLIFFNDTATTEIYTLSLHDALPIFLVYKASALPDPRRTTDTWREEASRLGIGELMLYRRSEEHTFELQSRQYLVCRLLLEKNTFYNRHLPFLFVHLTTVFLPLSSYC